MTLPQLRARIATLAGRGTYYAGSKRAVQYMNTLFVRVPLWRVARVSEALAREMHIGVRVIVRPLSVRQCLFLWSVKEDAQC